MRPAFDDMDPQLRIAHLVAGFVQHTLTDEEHDELDDWVNAAPDHTRLFEDLTDPAATTAIQDWFAAPERALSRAAAQRHLVRQLHRHQRRPRRFTHPHIYARCLAAACALLLIVGIYQYTTNRNEHPAGEKGLANNTIPPIVNPTADSGLRHEAYIRYYKEGYCTVATPAGAQCRLTLGDGTEVWLNASSSLRYRPSFGGGPRSVSLEGEAYFEVARAAARPFLVQTGATTLLLSGARANINAYAGDSAVRTTLLRGRGQVQCGRDTRRLRAGQQARTTSAGLAIAPADTTETLAWKNGCFLFRNTPAHDLLAQLARWYGVTIRANALPTGHYHATLPRTASLDRVLAVLARTGNLRVRHQGNLLIVEP